MRAILPGSRLIFKPPRCRFRYYRNRDTKNSLKEAEHQEGEEWCERGMRRTYQGAIVHITDLHRE